MPFTNLWDVTFPPDTQLANLLGQDLRNFRIDTQQRMAAISGLDAAKPNFAGDAQPANWNGILFFATDTGKIYQFNNPLWTDVTSGFTLKSSLKIVVPVVHTGTVTQDTLFTINLPANVMGPTGRLRITLPIIINSLGGSTNSVFINFGASNIAGLNIPAGASLGKLVIEGGNNGVTNAQNWDNILLMTPNFVSSEAIGTSSAIDTTVGVAVVAKWRNGLVSDSQQFDYFTVEIY
jgi:hypothetical protein